MKRPVPVAGIVLIAAGILLLLRSTGVLTMRWSGALWVALALAGVVVVVRGFKRTSATPVFWGTLLFLGGIFGLLRAIPQLEVSSYYTAPALVLALGLAFAAAFICRPRSLPLLVGAVVFCLLAAGIWMVELGFLYRYDVVTMVQEYWPVALVLLGVSLLIPRRTSQ